MWGVLIFQVGPTELFAVEYELSQKMVERGVAREVPSCKLISPCLGSLVLDGKLY